MRWSPCGPVGRVCTSTSGGRRRLLPHRRGREHVGQQWKSFAAKRFQTMSVLIYPFNCALRSGADAALEGPDDQWCDSVPWQCAGYGLFTASQDQSVERVPDPRRVEVRVEYAFVLSPCYQVDHHLIV